MGETGCGKTTICQFLAALRHQKLFIVNCHQHTESSDFLGGLRPCRQRSENVSNLLSEERKEFSSIKRPSFVSFYRIIDLQANKLFEWVDGPLIEAMKNGHLFLADEISLTDDSVLERLNSLLGEWIKYVWEYDFLISYASFIH